MMKIQQTEVAVVGGGMIGSALALSLAQQGLKVTLIERDSPNFNCLAQPDLRISSLNITSVNLLRELNIWNTISSMRVHPYHKIEVWELEKSCVTFDANELKLSKLGYMVENSVLQQAIWQALDTNPNVILYAPATLIALFRDGYGYRLILNNSNELAAILVVGTDGTNSQVRQMADISSYTYKYNQFCMLISVRCEKDPGEITWQYFTPNGPRAFLPLFDSWASLVWYDLPSRILQLKNLSKLQLEHEIALHFPSRLGKVWVEAFNVFPLMRCHALKYVCENLALVGDAAHTIHPLAGQGVNLGYRDIKVLRNVIIAAREKDEPWASQDILSHYQYQRMIDNLAMQLVIDLFYFGFNNNLGLLRILRNIGLMMVESSKNLKLQILKYALGLDSFVP